MSSRFLYNQTQLISSMSIFFLLSFQHTMAFVEIVFIFHHTCSSLTKKSKLFTLKVVIKCDSLFDQELQQNTQYIREVIKYKKMQIEIGHYITLFDLTVLHKSPYFGSSA